VDEVGEDDGADGEGWANSPWVLLGVKSSGDEG
jgi:hypothetical protein